MRILLLRACNFFLLERNKIAVSFINLRLQDELKTPTTCYLHLKRLPRWNENVKIVFELPGDLDL